MEGRTVSHSEITMSQPMMPHQANPSGAVHGGEIMKLMDNAAAVVAVRHCHAYAVTARVDGINFFRPIKVSNLVIVHAYLTFVGRSTMDVRVEVVAEDIFEEKQHHALTAHFIMVCVDDKGKPKDVPPLILSSDKERRSWEVGKKRYESCRGDILAGEDEYRVCREDALF